MVLAASKLGNDGVDIVLANGDRVLTEPYARDLHGELAHGAPTTKDGWLLIRRGDEVVCIVPADML